jgi:hypothetical protein
MEGYRLRDKVLELHHVSDNSQLPHTKQIDRDLTASPEESHSSEAHEAAEGHLLLVSIVLILSWTDRSHWNIHLRLMHSFLRARIGYLLVTILGRATSFMMLDHNLLVDRPTRLINYVRHDDCGSKAAPVDN